VVVDVSLSTANDENPKNHPPALAETGAVGPTGPAAEAEGIVVLENIHKTYLLGIEGVPALR
jgi:hypothetical protein